MAVCIAKYHYYPLQVVENEFDVLLVSQFTLFGKLKGNKLEFVKVRNVRVSCRELCEWRPYALAYYDDQE